MAASSALVLLCVLEVMVVFGADMEDVCDEYSAHRTQDFIQILSSPYISLTPVARTFLTDDLEATSEWFKSLFVVTDTETNAASDQWRAVHNGEYDYTRWMDNHDGFQLEEPTLNQTFFFDGDFPIQKGGVFSRVQIPRTSWAMELSGPVIIDGSQFIEDTTPNRTFKVANADFVCRVALEEDDGKDEEYTQISPRFWWKSTFASADPEAAASFAKRYLFGSWITSEYPLGGNCTLSTWVQLPHNTYQLHFARTSPCETPSPNIDEWVMHQESIRILERGNFDQHMSNNVVLWTESLDPFVQKLKVDNMPFLVLELNLGLYGLFISIPKNAIVLQIRSDHLTVTKPTATFDACAASSLSAVHS